MEVWNDPKNHFYTVKGHASLIGLLVHQEMLQYVRAQHQN